MIFITILSSFLILVTAFGLILYFTTNDLEIEAQVSPYLFLFGVNLFPKDEILPYWDFSIYLLCLKVSFCWGFDEDAYSGDDYNNFNFN